MEMVVNGLSTRKVEQITQELIGTTQTKCIDTVGFVKERKEPAGSSHVGKTCPAPNTGIWFRGRAVVIRARFVARPRRPSPGIRLPPSSPLLPRASLIHYFAGITSSDTAPNGEANDRCRDSPFFVTT